MPLFRAWRRRVVRVLLRILAVALAIATAASAATPPAGSVSSTNTSTSFTGTLTMSNFLQPGDVGTSFGTPCPSQAMDPEDLVCGHFTLTTQSPGTVQVCVQFQPPSTDIFGMTDLDVFVVDTSTGNVIAAGTSQSNP